MIKIVKLCIAASFFVALVTPLAVADELTVPYVVDGACPVEGCTFGMWEVQKNVPVYKDTNTESGVAGQLTSGTKVNVKTGTIFVVP